jgi:hypothetical protein
MRDASPADTELAAALTTASPDPGPFLAGMTTTRLRFNADFLWSAEGQASPGGH